MSDTQTSKGASKSVEWEPLIPGDTTLQALPS